MAILFFQTNDTLLQMDLLIAELTHLLGERFYEIFGEDFRKAGDVEDVFLRVERRELPAQLRQRVDDLRGRTAHSRIEQSEDPRWTAADDGDVAKFVIHGGEG